ncbi:DUF6894 family protein [Sphingomonas sp.]|jgi:hypothetical protein|uniref:DUF6894 family protein n=1 Tax=Sphingomonas sp. TaxID=28214 RepID=UPI002E32A4DF|nr:hypothetical protein [Sphingomonas sp.]HEX4693142.1 hypothetical protein [Sphingomonas sp.]
MPRYHFNIHDGTDVPDLEGVKLADLAAARIHATRYASDLLRDQQATFWNGNEWRMSVTDEHGLILFSLTFLATDAPVLGRD